MTIEATLLTITIGSVLALAATAEAARSNRQVVGYILRFRPAARRREEVDTSTTHIGFRCIVRAGR
jgi:hypothetical protein